MKLPQAAVLVFPGSNGERDLAAALRASGFAVHLHDARLPLPAAIRLAALPGGFAYGDYWRAGLLASQARAVADLSALVARRGLLLGICNGLQILLAARLLPGALTLNQPLGFVHRWLKVRCEKLASASPWLNGLQVGQELRLPIAHGCGQYVLPPDAAVAVPFTYVGKNPNGSQRQIAGVLDASGLVLGLMPHPERAMQRLLGSDDGRGLFAAAQAYARALP